MEAPGIEAGDANTRFVGFRGVSDALSDSSSDSDEEPGSVSQRFAGVQCSNVVSAAADAHERVDQRTDQRRTGIGLRASDLPPAALPWQGTGLRRLAEIDEAIRQHDHRRALERCLSLLDSIVVEQASVGYDRDASQAGIALAAAAERMLATVITDAVCRRDRDGVRAGARALMAFTDTGHEGGAS